MENEIELKIMLYPQNIPMIKTWLNQLNALEYQQNILGNTYYDSPDLFFAKNKMGLRVRNKNHQYELTLKQKEILPADYIFAPNIIYLLKTNSLILKN